MFTTSIVLALWPGALRVGANGRPASAGLTVFLLATFLVFWVAMCWGMLYSGSRTRRSLRGGWGRTTTGGGGEGIAAVVCTFEFAPKGGPPVRATDRLRVGADLGRDDPPTAAVLHDPDRPERAVLVAGLPRGVSVNGLGDWELEGL